MTQIGRLRRSIRRYIQWRALGWVIKATPSDEINTIRAFGPLMDAMERDWDLRAKKEEKDNG